MSEKLKDMFIQNENDFSTNDYNMLLLNLIPYLKQFPYNEGGEGKAYFIFDKLIVKEYTTFNDEYLFNSLFESYCKEMQTFSKKHYSVPKIYSWAKIPSVIVKEGRHQLKYRYFILEEQIKGRELFVGFLEDAYHICKKLCSEKEFNKLIKYPEYDHLLYAEIVKSYVEDYMKMNMAIEAMSESELENFIMNIYGMYKDGEFSIPDVYPTNMLYTGKDIFIIDNNLTDRKNDSTYLSRTPETFTMTSLMFIFLYNEQVSSFSSGPYFLLENTNLNLEKLIKENGLLCEAAIRKLLKVAKKCMDNPSIKDNRIIERLYQILKNIMGKETAYDIINFSRNSI